MAQAAAKPRVLICGLSSCYGCQLQLTNAEPDLLGILSQFEIAGWQLLTSAPASDACEVCVIEGAVTSEEQVGQLLHLRSIAAKVVAVGACATTAGVPGLHGLRGAGTSGFAPRPVREVIEVDYEVVGCPADTAETVSVLQRALRDVPAQPLRGNTLCGSCKLAERSCFMEEGTLCLGLVTNEGCNAACTAIGRPCMGCRGISQSANLRQARLIAKASGVAPECFDAALQVFSARQLEAAAAERQET